jgi:catechol 2,3-dioxygenase-like lactoylglutathione lyase family enzyme
VFVNDLTPMAHVMDVDASCRFYELLGFHVEHRWGGPGQGTNAASLAAGDARLLLAGATPFAAEDQAVLFYLYADDVESLREHLVAVGLEPGPVTRPPYMPLGEFRLADPDGYVLLVGQRG